MKKIYSILAAASVAMMTTFSCTKVDTYEDTTNPIPVPEAAEETLQGLSISPKTSYVVIGEPVALTVGLVPENASVDKLAWTSSDEAVATVDAEGNVTTLAKGVALITAKVGDQSVTAIVNVFAERVPATAIQLNKSEINLLVGRATKVKATLLPDGSVEGENPTTDQLNLEWKSSNEQVATVSYGFIQAVGLGEATITASQNGLSATVKVTVADKIKLIDRTGAWTITDTPKWDKNSWSGQITGSHVDVNLAGFDGEYAYFKAVSADKFTNVEDIANTVYEQVEERKDAGQNPKNLFTTGESQTQRYNDTGDAVAYVLGYDEEFEFTGEYLVYNFVGRTPDPVHATGIQFVQGWGNTPISSVELKAGKKMNMFGAILLPEDCTDTGSITFTSSDESIVTLQPYYNNYYTLVAGNPGETTIVATFGDVEASIPVTVTSSDVVWTDRSSVWTGAWGMGLYYGYYECFGFTLNSCTSPAHLAVIVNADEISGNPADYYKTVAKEQEGNVEWYASSDIPEFVAQSWNDKDDTIERYAYVFGVTNGSYDGNYAIFHYIPGQPQPVEAKVINMKNAFFDYTWPDDLATLDEVTMETWVNTAGNPGKNESIMGIEGVFLLRTESNQFQLICGGDKRSNGEYTEIKLATDWTTGEWVHLAAVYSRSAKKAYLYVNGEQKATADLKDHGVDMNGVGAKWNLPFSFMIGNACEGNRYVQGTIAYTRVWKSARSASDITGNMYKSDVSGSDLIGSWYFNEGSGNTIADHSGNGRTLTGKSYVSSMNYPETTVEWIDGTLPF
ncbi:MAG: Ig-like domain-containing protein [Bacteroidales bacterium]|nr:Ig-like domain-containing protein [Bacteroidales bacterium]